MLHPLKFSNLITRPNITYTALGTCGSAHLNRELVIHYWNLGKLLINTSHHQRIVNI